VIIEYSWEFLNTNIWSFVEDKWRFIYGYGTMYKIIFTHHSNRLNGDSEAVDSLNTELIKLCDLGLLMCGNLLERQFNNMIRHIRAANEEVEDEFRSSSSSSSKRLKLDQNDKLLSTDSIMKLAPEYSIKIEDSPSFEHLKENYVDKEIPVIIRNQMNHWPAMRKWSIDYLIRLAGKRTVPIEIGSKYSDADWSQKLMTIEEFIKRFILNDAASNAGKNEKSEEKNTKGYLAQHPLFDQVRL
jgi:lysine-specific demethylase 8